MTPLAAIIPLFTHFSPLLFFVYMMVDVLVRSRKRIEHRLVFAIIFCCMMMFAEEFVRHYMPIEYSPIISVVWFSTAGIFITGFGLHLFVKLTQLDRKMPRFVYPYLFYLPVLLVLINLLFNDQMISGNEFVQVGIWKLPVYNTAYYAAMIGSNLFNLIYIAILYRGRIRKETREYRMIYNHLIVGVLATMVFNLGIGLIDFKGYLPPYPYIYGGFVWCVLLRRTMLKYDFLNHEDKRYEKLFNMNPAAIMMIDLFGNVKEANPEARKLFAYYNLEQMNLYAVLGDDIKKLIESGDKIEQFEWTTNYNGSHIDLLIDGDYVMVDYETHLILIIRDVTMERTNQREISFLAFHDTLTRLPNRRRFFEQLNEVLKNARTSGSELALVLFDLDNFKEINDKYGHLFGDQALVHTADILRETVMSYGAAARLGGDEFIFYLYPIESRQSVKQIVVQLQQAFHHNPLKFGAGHVPIIPSIGISIYPYDGTDSNTLLNSADRAMYEVKRHGRNHYLFASESN